MSSAMLIVNVILVMFMAASGIDLHQAKLDLAAGGSRVCQYCPYCVYQSYCDRSCTYAACSLCKYRYHCSSTCTSGVCHPQNCSLKTCGANETCYEVSPGRGECRCINGTICDEDDDCVRKANQGDCDFYTCFENRRNCGSKGYMLAYGRKYCNKFGEDYDNFTEQGQQWIDCTRQCLTGALRSSYRANTLAGQGCHDVKVLAFHTHVDCYVNCGFCNIWSTNKAALFGVYSVKDFLQWQAIAQVTSVGNQCFVTAIDSMVLWAHSVGSHVVDVASQVGNAVSQVGDAISLAANVASQAKKVIDHVKWMVYPYPRLFG